MTACAVAASRFQCRELRLVLGLDTNVLVRFLVEDDAPQLERAKAMIRCESRGGRRILISQLVLLESEWVLRSRYEFSKHEIMGALSGMLESVEFSIEDESSVERALYVWKDFSSDFADCLTGARYENLGCRATATFDAKTLKLTGFVAP
jgi:predicted nucleic-acid-binding protein